MSDFKNLSENFFDNYINGYLEVVKSIQVTNNNTFIMASKYGHLEIVKCLVDQGADVQTNNNYAIKIASINGNSEVIKYLVRIYSMLTI